MAPVQPWVSGATGIFQMCTQELSPMQAELLKYYVTEYSRGFTLFILSWPFNNGEVRSTDPSSVENSCLPFDSPRVLHILGNWFQDPCGSPNLEMLKSL